MNEDIDPDTNFYKAQCKTSPYFMDSEFNNYVCSKSLCDDQFSIIHINARSLNKNIDNLKLLINRLRFSFSVIAITETWTTEMHQFLNVPGYKCYLKSHSDGYGGVAIYVKEQLSVSELICVITSLIVLNHFLYFYIVTVYKS